MSNSYASAIVDVHGDELGIETNCQPAFDYLSRMTHLLDPRVSFRFTPRPLVDGLLVLRYESAERYEMTFDAREDVLTLLAPWSEVPSSTLLRVSVWLLSELARQRRGHYLFHASAVVRPGMGILLLGQSGSGKTTTALELCLNHGFSLYANDQVRVCLKGDTPIFLAGDPEFNCRLTSLKQYSPELAERIFGQRPPGEDPSQVKRRLRPAELGIEQARGEHPITHLAFVRLDDTAQNGVIQEVVPVGGDLGDPARDALLLSKLALFQEISGLVRGADMVPFDSKLGYVKMFVPDLDSFALLDKRVDFLNAVFNRARVFRGRADLNALVRALLAARAA